jgi:hypothetical protein
MKNSTTGRILNLGILALVTIVLIATVAMGQNLIVSGSGSFSGAGTINVKGNINTSGASAAVSIPGTVNLNGALSTQQLGVSGSNALTFSQLIASGSIAKQMDVNVTVSDALTVNITGGLNFDLQANTLTLGGTSALTLGSLDVSDAGNSVVYNRASGSQTMLGLAYVGAVTLSGAAAKDLSANASVAGAFAHSGGDMTVNHNLSVSYATPSFTTIADVTGNSTLALSGTGAKAIGQISGIAAGSSISNSGASGLLTVTTLAGNAGSIAGGVGGVTFANAATNGGNITGGSGAITFSNTLAHSTGTITAGSGGVVFNGIPTIASGSVTAGTGASLDFNTNIANSGTISLTGTGAATINGDFTSVGTLAFANGSQVTFDGAGQTIPVATYGNVTMDGTSAKTAAGSATLAGNLVLNQNLDMFTNGGTLTFSSAGTVAGGSEIIGSVQRTHQLDAGTAYAFNRAEVTMQFASNENADVTLTMRPGVAPTGVGVNYVNRYYGVSSTADLSTNNARVQLYYLDAERVGSLNEAKYGLNKYTTSLSKLGSNGGTYARVDGAPANTLALSNINQGLTGVSEFAITPIGFYTVATGNWNAIATWGSTADDIPSATDDAEVRHTVAVPTVSTIANLTITDDATYTGVLNIDGANFTATTLTSTGAVNVSATRTLTVGGSFVNNSGAASSVLINGIAALVNVTNNGTFTVDGVSAQANLSGAFLNNSGATLTTANSGAVTVTGADLTNAGTITNAGSITVQ